MKSSIISVSQEAKQLFVIIFILASTYTCCYSQTTDFKPYFSFGTSHGISLSSINFYPSVTQQQLIGYYGGVSANYISEKNFGIQVELNYSQRGWKEKNETSAAVFERRLNYFEMPVLTHFYLGNKFRWMLNLGPKIGYLLSESSTNATESSSHPEYTLPIVNKFDYGICAGTGFELMAGTTSYTVEARYSLSLNDIFANSKKDNFSNSGNQFISITLGVFLRFSPQHHGH